MPTPSPVDAVAKLNTALARLPAIATSITAVRLVRVYDIQHGHPATAAPCLPRSQRTALTSMTWQMCIWPI